MPEPGPEPGTGTGTDRPKTPARPAARAARVALALAIAAVTLVLLWRTVGSKAWDDYKAMQAAQAEAEDSAPVGFVGINYRRSYNNRPIKFGVERDGKLLLIASTGDDGQPTAFYDLTGVDLDPDRLGGGFGRDSIPGIDYPIFEAPDSELGRNFRDRMTVYAAVVGNEPRVYARDLLAKIELVNDREPGGPFVVVFDRSRDQAWAFARTLDGAEVTFGTTGYGLGGRPLLYDRATESLWFPGPEGLEAIGGPSKGTVLPVAFPLETTTWGDWRSSHPASRLLVGGDRDRPIPED